MLISEAFAHSWCACIGSACAALVGKGYLYLKCA